MTQKISAEVKLNERIKELTCLYNVSSFIANSDLENLEPTWQAIAYSLQGAIRYPEDASVELKIEDEIISAGAYSTENVYIVSAIKTFNIPIGSIKVGYTKTKFNQNSFLNEEIQLLNKIALEIGNLFERKQIIESEAQAKRHIERVDRLGILGEITAGIAHELNTPLANILGYTELLKDQFKDNKPVLNDLDKIINSAIYSREVVKKLMFFSCDMPHQMEFSNIVPIIEDAIGLLNPNFTKKNINCQLDIEKEEILLRVDAIQLTQVIFNLVINAIYFSPEKGKIHVQVSDTDKIVTLKISDQGPGIKTSSSENIFNPFFTTKPVGEGSGLGLSVVHGIVKSHKGSITFDINKPNGTIFTIKLPKN
ncbi:HAMP domain-containing sensor histidine kinase [Xanthomarina sp. F1114]|uniref:sensor histidine kinase n=1 Tax=Xanthomarina sp. F1114 TaxID=2996019 RepID=UPI00225E09B0|nr:HAMP domain-containing sensor histidine kinase [Xanthomarina sp. F1114]MCX7548635.1 HAMP domain-containing sensor histidine kinase [Xanthomarina sp. F1114]